MKIIYALRLLFLVWIACISTSAGMLKENYSFHSIYIYNFAKYIQWPNPGTELIIGVSGGNPEIMEALEKMAYLKSTPELKLIVRKVQSPGDVAACHILYVPQTESSKAGIYAARTDGGRLIVTEGEGMLQKGGMINFVLVGKKLRYEINREALEKAGLKVSSQLVGLAVQ